MGRTTIGGELAIWRDASRHKLVFGRLRGSRTMMQPCASAAKPRGGGPILHRGSRAMLALGSPPPRTVFGGPPQRRPRRILQVVLASCPLPQEIGRASCRERG